MKRVLVISPYFPPINAADMQRVRMSLPYFKEYGWNAEVVTVDPKHSDVTRDELLTQSLPHDVVVHYVNAVPKRWTSKLGLGSIALRAMPYYRGKVNELLANKRFDLIYFSTTQFPICVLGRYWKKRFGIPFVIDMQDPWRSDYYLDKPKHLRPPKFWFSYRLDKYLERLTMTQVDGLVSVSKKYLDELAGRYRNCAVIPTRTVTFGVNPQDLEVARKNRAYLPKPVGKTAEEISISYVGRGGADMGTALHHLFRSFARGLSEHPSQFAKIRFYFIGTSYAAAGTGAPSVLPIATENGVEQYVTELTDRIPFYESLATLLQSNALVVPGSDDAGYTASKIYPYLLCQKPLLSIFHPMSSVVALMEDCGSTYNLNFQQPENEITQKIIGFLLDVVNDAAAPLQLDEQSVYPLLAKTKTEEQCMLFNEVLVEAKSRSRLLKQQTLTSEYA